MRQRADALAQTLRVGLVLAELRVQLIEARIGARGERQCRGRTKRHSNRDRGRGQPDMDSAPSKAHNNVPTGLAVGLALSRYAAIRRRFAPRNMGPPLPR